MRERCAAGTVGMEHWVSCVLSATPGALGTGFWAFLQPGSGSTQPPSETQAGTAQAKPKRRLIRARTPGGGCTNLPRSCPFPRPSLLAGFTSLSSLSCSVSASFLPRPQTPIGLQC